MASRHQGAHRRRLLLQAVSQSPGVHKSELQERTGLAWGTLTHHLHQLHRRGEISMLKDGHRVALFPSRIPSENREALSLLAQPQARSVLRCIQKMGKASIQDVVAELGGSRKPIRRCMLALQERGVLLRQGSGWGQFEVQEGATDIVTSSLLPNPVEQNLGARLGEAASVPDSFVDAS